MSPAPIGNADQTQSSNNFFFRVRSATPIGAGNIGAPIGVAEYKEDAYFHNNRLLIELNQPEKEILCRKDDGPIKK